MMSKALTGVQDVVMKKVGVDEITVSYRASLPVGTSFAGFI